MIIARDEIFKSGGIARQRKKKGEIVRVGRSSDQSIKNKRERERETEESER